jgi:tRNA threonylcarbamoyladenosine biosynthesis protein TsaE
VLILVPDEEAMALVATKVAASVCAGDIITLSGTLGAGKTVFAKGLIRALGFPGEVTSPTFAIVHDYSDDNMRLPVLHADLYRLDNPEDLQELGLDEVLPSGLLLVEWPELLGVIAWPDILKIGIEILPDNTRRLTADVPPSWEGRWPFQ